MWRVEPDRGPSVGLRPSETYGVPGSLDWSWVLTMWLVTSELRDPALGGTGAFFFFLFFSPFRTPCRERTTSGFGVGVEGA